MGTQRIIERPTVAEAAAYLKIAPEGGFDER